MPLTYVGMKYIVSCAIVILQHKEGNTIDLSDGFTVTSLGNGLLPQIGTSLASGDRHTEESSLQ